VDFADIPQVLARGKIVVNLSACYDEEGITAKPFEIAASGCAMLHNRSKGIEQFFEDHREIAVFDRPRQAIQQVEALLSDDRRRRDMGAAARARVERDHSWDTRLTRLLTCSGFALDSFRASTSVAPALARAA
jgi:spore maturation protein CgeB